MFGKRYVTRMDLKNFAAGITQWHKEVIAKVVDTVDEGFQIFGETLEAVAKAVDDHELRLRKLEESAG